MEIVEYEDKYRKDFENLMYMLEEYFKDMDSLKKATVTEDYKKVYIDYTLRRVNENSGKIFLAVENNDIIGAIVGVLLTTSEVEATNYIFNKEGEITELVIDKNYRGQGIGAELIKKMEDYFKTCGCDIIRLGAFAENKRALTFYEKQGYSIRNVDFIKKID